MGLIPTLAQLNTNLLNAGMVQLFIGNDPGSRTATLASPTTALDGSGTSVIEDQATTALTGAGDDEITTLSGARFHVVHPKQRITVGRRRVYQFAAPDIMLTFSAKLSKELIEKFQSVGTMDNSGFLQPYEFTLQFTDASNSKSTITFSGWLFEHSATRPEDVQETTVQYEGTVQVLELREPAIQAVS